MCFIFSTHEISAFNFRLDKQIWSEKCLSVDKLWVQGLASSVFFNSRRMNIQMDVSMIQN
jgi:hypothetical protein